MLARINIREILDGTKVLISLYNVHTSLGLCCSHITDRFSHSLVHLNHIKLLCCYNIFNQECHYHIFSLMSL